MLIDSEDFSSLNFKQVISSELKQKRRELIALIQRKVTLFKYKLKTFYLAISLLDRIILTEIFSSLESEVAALVCLLLAGKCNLKSVKFDEDDAIIPDLNDFGFLNYKNFFTVDDIRRYEVIILQILEYRLKVYTPFNFLYYLCLCGIFFSDECAYDEFGNIVLNCSMKDNFFINNRLIGIDKMFRLCFDVLEVVILSKTKFYLDPNYMNFSPFKIACSIVSYVRELYGFNCWSTRFEAIFSIIFESNLAMCYEFIKR